MRYKGKFIISFSQEEIISQTSGDCAWNHCKHLATSPRLTIALRIAEQRGRKNLVFGDVIKLLNEPLLEPACLVISCFVAALLQYVISIGIVR